MLNTEAFFQENWLLRYSAKGNYVMV